MRIGVCLFLSLAAAPALSSRLILIAPSRSETPCLGDSFFGEYGRPLQRVYIAEEDCVLEGTQLLPSGHVQVYPEQQAQRLLWLQEAGVDDSLRQQLPSFSHQLAAFLDNLASLDKIHGALRGHFGEDSLAQHVLSTKALQSHNHVQSLWQSGSSALISVPDALLPIIDVLLPEFIVPVSLPSQPLGHTPINPHAIQHIQSILSKLAFHPTIASILSSLSTLTMRMDVRYLTGESSSGILSRHSFSQGARDAADWIQRQIEQSGAICEQRPFRPGFSPNVVCRYPSTTNSSDLAILSAHYDSRGSFGSVRAPGGDDDGSGTTHLLAIARVIKEKRITFKQNFELVAFAGEEQGLVGSRAYAEELRRAGANVSLHIQADMLAYHAPSEPPQLGLPDLIGLPEAAWLVGNVSQIYAPELAVGYTPACCSDHQSFHEQGFPATQVFERAGAIIDPMYHNSGDLSNRTGYDLEQLQSIAKVTFATMLEVVGFDLPEEE